MKELYHFLINASIGELILALLIATILITFIWEILTDK